ncbi:MAG: hypothetical protein WCJ64_05855 [Rhodospirillaceae bacterium]
MSKIINPGDRFRRMGQICKAKTYSVVAVFEPNGHQMHAKLANDELPYEIITISIPTLADPRFWERLKSRPDSG